MSAHFHIDVSKIEMYRGAAWLDLGELCTHDCTHWGISTIAWGATVAEYELLRCDDCQCRTWLDGRWAQERERGGNSGFWMSRLEWREPIAAVPPESSAS